MCTPYGVVTTLVARVWVVSYPLGVDVGTTFTAAALWRDGRVQTVPLGNRSHAVPSVVYLREDGTLLIGEAAVRRGIAEPGRAAREFKRRIGDDVPLLLGGHGFAAHELTGHVLRWVVDRVSELQGGPPEHIVLTYPAEWGDYRRGLYLEAARAAGFGRVGLLAEPVAAATWYATQERVEPDSLIGIYDFGGGTFDASVVCKTSTGVEIYGEPGGDDAIGGIDFDHALFRYVGQSAGVDFSGLDAGDPAIAAALANLLASVVDAKEALSADSEAVVPVLLPGLTTQVLLTRADFEALIRSQVLETVEVFGRVVRQAGVDPDSLHAVLLVGGTSRIPLVREMLTTELGIPAARVAVDAHPKYTVCLGAAIVEPPGLVWADPGAATDATAVSARPEPTAAGPDPNMNGPADEYADALPPLAPSHQAPAPEQVPQPSADFQQWLRPQRRSVSRRVVLLGLAGLGVAGVAALGVTIKQLSNSAPNPGELRWRAVVGGEVHGAPALAGDTVYVTDTGGTLRALSASDGRQLWTYAAAGPMYSAPAVATGLVLAGSRDGKLHAVDAASGAPRWAFATGDWIDSSPVAIDGRVYVGSADRSLYAIDLASGSPLWKFPMDGKVFCPPAVAGDVVYVGNTDTKLYAVDASAGTLRWKFATGGNIYAGAAVSGDTVCVASTDANVYGLDAATGGRRWSFRTEGDIRSNLTVVDGTTYVGCQASTLYALDIATGQPRWTFRTEGAVASPAAAGVNVYVGSTDGRLYAVDLATGQESWRFNGGARIGSATVDRGVVYFGSVNGNVYAVWAGASAG